MNAHICGHAAAGHPPSRNMVPIGFNLRHGPKNTGICEHHLLPRLGSPVEKAEGEQLMRRCVPSLENKRAVIFGLHEEKIFTTPRC
jgi:hypothetical protein